MISSINFGFGSFQSKTMEQSWRFLVLVILSAVSEFGGPGKVVGNDVPVCKVLGPVHMGTFVFVFLPKKKHASSVLNTRTAKYSTFTTAYL